MAVLRQFLYNKHPFFCANAPMSRGRKRAMWRGEAKSSQKEIFSYFYFISIIILLYRSKNLTGRWEDTHGGLLIVFVFPNVRLGKLSKSSVTVCPIQYNSVIVMILVCSRDITTCLCWMLRDQTSGGSPVLLLRLKIIFANFCFNFSRNFAFGQHLFYDF